VASGSAPAEAAAVSGVRRWTGGRVALVVLGSLAALLAFGLAGAGGTVVVLDKTQRDSDGYLMSPSKHFSTASYALVTKSVDLGGDGAGRDFVGTIRIRTESTRPAFVGIGRSSAVTTYLGGVRRAEVRDIAPWHVSYDVFAGGRPSAPPGSQSFWAASVTGPGEQILDWKPSAGTWRLVVMNTGGSPRVAVDASVGAKLANLIWVGVGLLAAGIVFAFVAAGLIHLGVRRSKAPAQP
jgi:hypothetical protein